MSEQWGTHGVEVLDDRVVKRFRSAADGEPGREWRALSLLAEHCPGLAPEPLAADLAGPVPAVVMGRLPGTPLRGGPVSRGQAAALAGVLTRMHTEVPGAVVERLPVRLWGEHHAARGIRERYATVRGAEPGWLSAEVRRAVEDGMHWLGRTALATGEPGAGVPAVFGQADGNLANYLWDGARVRVVDFEDSGRSDRAYELADVVEHVSVWVDSDFDVPHFLGCFELTEGEARRLAECRRLLALLWLLVLGLQDPAEGRNPAGTAERQARRLLELLG
ncbi:phosphotransferase family protein [Kitasatospora sp. NPDC096147]|uniref:phosphotransferase family protein n=1 Tax=Kitasatospora sp. NPDC096147 TaxID=3364093 RepID=UPI0037F5426C